MFTLPVEKIIKGGIKMKVKKVEDKNVKVVAGQANCSEAGHSIYYEGQGDCLNDCTRADKPRYYASKTH
jgi:hypothetical protein